MLRVSEPEGSRDRAWGLSIRASSPRALQSLGRLGSSEANPGLPTWADQNTERAAAWGLRPGQVHCSESVGNECPGRPDSGAGEHKDHVPNSSGSFQMLELQGGRIGPATASLSLPQPRQQPGAKPAATAAPESHTEMKWKMGRKRKTRLGLSPTGAPRQLSWSPSQRLDQNGGPCAARWETSLGVPDPAPMVLAQR